MLYIIIIYYYINYVNNVIAMAVSLRKIRNTVITWCRGGSFHKCVLDTAASGLNAGFSHDMFELPDVLVKVDVT